MDAAQVYEQYHYMIQGLARKIGFKPDEIDDVIQSFLLHYIEYAESKYDNSTKMSTFIHHCAKNFLIRLRRDQWYKVRRINYMAVSVNELTETNPDYVLLCRYHNSAPNTETQILINEYRERLSLLADWDEGSWACVDEEVFHPSFLDLFKLKTKGYKVNEIAAFYDLAPEVVTGKVQKLRYLLHQINEGKNL